MSRELLVRWLSQYKFKDWNKTESRHVAVTDEMKKDRAANIAEILGRNDFWHSHGRGIDLSTLRDLVGLKIDDYSEMGGLAALVREYFELLRDYMQREQLISFVHTREYF